MEEYMYNNKYCVILDAYRDSFPYDWAITVAKDTCKEAESVGYFDNEPDLVPRSAYKAELVKSTTLIFKPNPSYGKYQGGIYLMSTV
jgi:hypothetical protein